MKTGLNASKNIFVTPSVRRKNCPFSRLNTVCYSSFNGQGADLSKTARAAPGTRFPPSDRESGPFNGLRGISTGKFLLGPFLKFYTLV
jgi:hypothetical protein